MAKNSIEAIAEDVLVRERKIADDKLKIDEGKELLRAHAEAIGKGFTLEIKGKGTIEVKGAREAELKGVEPALNIKAFLDLSEAKRKAYAAVVEWKEIWTKAAKPSVTVRL